MKVEFIVKNAFVYQTYRQCFEKKDFMVAGDRIFSVMPAMENSSVVREQYGSDVKIIDAAGRYIIPGLIDIHMHIESSMTYPYEFSNEVLKYGVTSVVADPHEIANVFGMEGIESFMKQQTALDIFYGIPSSVPSTNEETETNGADISVTEVEQLLTDPRVICLGEVMNFKDIVSDQNTKIKAMIQSCKKNDRHIRIEGHCPKLSDVNYNRFIFEGVDSDHTQQTSQSLLQKVDLGMFVELQKKSLTKEVIDTVIKYNLYESIALITDDTMPDHLVNGHLNEIVKKAVSLGMPMEKAIYCATYTPARRMFLTDRGAISPGKKADFIILKDLKSFTIEEVYKSGVKWKPDLRQTIKAPFPTHFYNSVKCRQAQPSDFVVQAQGDGVTANIISISEFGTFTTSKTVKLPVRDGKVCWQDAGLSLVTIFERYGKNGNIAHGFVENAFTRQGAVATTWSHDSHNLLVLGNCVEDMVMAQHEILKMQGGYCVVSGGKVTASAPLKIGGIVSDQPVHVLAEQIKQVRTEIEALGYVNSNVIMSISTLALVVSPELKMTDIGLFDVTTQKFKKLIE